jgi:hypothetical protein
VSLPLTERVLTRLPGDRWTWIAVWASLPWLNAGANLLLGADRTSAVWEQSTFLIVVNYAALSFASGFTMWASGRLVREVEALRPNTAASLTETTDGLFRGIYSATGPLLASAAIAIIFAVSTLVQEGLLPATVRGATWFAIGIGMWTFLWTYVSLLFGLNRLGRERLVPEQIPMDPILGLQPLGRIAATGLWMLLIWLVPVVLTGLPDVAGFIVGMLVLAVALATLFLSLVGLHRQMVEVKSRELSLARDLYHEAYRPVHDARSLDALEEQRSLLSAADALEKRADAIHEWPFDEGTITRVITITTSVIAITIGRLILDPLGL